MCGCLKSLPLSLRIPLTLSASFTPPTDQRQWLLSFLLLLLYRSLCVRIAGSLLNSSHAIAGLWNPPVLLLLIQPICLMKTLVALIASETVGAVAACTPPLSSTAGLAATQKPSNCSEQNDVAPFSANSDEFHPNSEMYQVADESLHMVAAWSPWLTGRAMAPQSLTIDKDRGLRNAGEDKSTHLLTSGLGPATEPGHVKVTNSWHRLWTTKLQTGRGNRRS